MPLTYLRLHETLSPSPMSSNIYVEIGSSSDSSPESITSVSSLLISVGIIKLSSDSSPLSALSQVSDNEFPSSKCVNVIISPVCPLKYVAQGIYDTAIIIAIISAWGYDVYDNVLEKLSSQTTS